MNDDASPDVAYEEQLPSYRLIVEIQRLLGLARRTERTLCRYMADLADRIRDRADVTLALYADEFHAARCFFGLGARETRERVRIGRALRCLSEIDRAFEAGHLSYSRVREITRVATAETELEWLALAQNADMRTLERSVAAVRQRTEPTAETRDASHAARDESARPEWKTPQTVRVSFELSAEAWALVQRALEGARRTSEVTLSDSAALEAIARDAIAHQTNDIEASDPRRAIVLYQCQHCERSELDTGAGSSGATIAEPSLAYGARPHAANQTQPEHPQPDAMRTESTLASVDGATSSADAETPRGDGETSSVDAETPRGDGETSSATRGGARDCELRAAGLVSSATQGVSRDCELRAATSVSSATQGGSCYSEAAAVNMARLLRVMGGRGGWTADELVQQSGLPARDVSAALTFLELDAQIRHGQFGFEPVANRLVKRSA